MTDKKQRRITRWIIYGLALITAFWLGGIVIQDSPDEDLHALAGKESSAKPEVWTCSMHPNIQLPKQGKCPICFMDLIPLESGSIDEAPRELSMSEAARAIAGIQTTPVKRQYAAKEIRMSGSIVLDETRIANISAWVPGRLDRLFADYTGIAVSKGDHLAQIYSPELAAAQEEFLTARRSLDSLPSGANPSLRNSIRSTVSASREKLRLLGLSDLQIDKILKRGESSEHLTIYAPIGGVVVDKHVNEGVYVKTGQKIYTLADLSRLWVLFDAYESDLPWLRYGQSVQFGSQSLPGASFTGTITFIDPVIDPVRRTVRVRAIVDNPGRKLKPNMFVSGTVESILDDSGRVIDLDLAGKWISPMHPEVIKEGPGQCDVCGMDLVPIESLGYASASSASSEPPLIIPASAPLLTGKRAIVYVELDNHDGPLFEGRTVELGPRAGEFYVVKNGLAEGDRVVLNGAFKIDAELQLKAKPSMMSADTERMQPLSESHSAGIQKLESLDISGEARAALTPVYEQYFKIQMALANDDFENASSGYGQFVAILPTVDMSLFTGKAHMRWMELSEQMADAATEGFHASGIEQARDAFKSLSDRSIELHTLFGHADGTFYLTYCPMAFDNTGAYWLQTADIVWNSYWGDRMLRCGSLKDTMPAGSVE